MWLFKSFAQSSSPVSQASETSLSNKHLSDPDLQWLAMQILICLEGGLHEERDSV